MSTLAAGIDEGAAVGAVVNEGALLAKTSSANGPANSPSVSVDGKLLSIIGTVTVEDGASEGGGEGSGPVGASVGEGITLDPFSSSVRRMLETPLLRTLTVQRGYECVLYDQ